MASQPSKEPSGHQSNAGENAAELLEQELERAKAELAEYQALISEVPSIYETKFRQQVQLLAFEIRRLLEERRSLHQQLPASPLPQAESPALPAAASASESEAPVDPADARPDGPTPRRPRCWRLGLCRRWCSSARRLSLRKRLPLLIGTMTAVALLVVGIDAMGRCGQMPRDPRPSSEGGVVSKPASEDQAEGEHLATPSVRDPQVPPWPGQQDLQLRADGPCWVQVETANGQVLLAEQLKKGDQRSFPLGDGLRVRAGRPDLLKLAVTGEDDFRALAAINYLGWRTFLPAQGGSVPGAD